MEILEMEKDPPKEAIDSSLVALQGISIIEYLCRDSRPTFVLDLGEDPLDSNQATSLTFINRALRERRELFNLVNDQYLGTSTKLDSQPFWDWTRTLRDNASTELHFAGSIWMCTGIGLRWRIITANTIQHSSLPILPSQPSCEESTSTSDYSSGGTGKNDADDRVSPEHQVTYVNGKVLDPLVRARSFFVGSTVEDEVNLAGKAVPEDKSQSSNLAWSDVSIAKRNAELLARISASDSVGITLANKEGEIVYANNAWYNICGLPLGKVDTSSWMSIFQESELPMISEMWRQVIVDQQQKWTENLIQKQLTDAVDRAKVLEKVSNDLASMEARHRRLMDSIPHGIFMCDVLGNMLFTNVGYRNIFPASQESSIPEPWLSYIPEEEGLRAQEIWGKLQENCEETFFEMKFLKSSGGSPDERRHMAISAYPEMNEGGGINHIAGCIADISHLKREEQLQRARADNIEESNRKLEHFIDMTSHEIRNPLSAIVHSAEEILLLLRSPDSTNTTNAIEAVETIINCTNHSTRIVDDILMVSKLESNLVSIAPTAVQLVPAVKNTLRMFDGEMRAADISTSLTVDQSLGNSDWVYLDISRVLQILVNLITNAIKFTRPEKLRQIDIRIQASSTKPTDDSDLGGRQYLPAHTAASVAHPDSTVNTGEVTYISIDVTDSGCGMSVEEQKKLFKRFSQAGNRTHVRYGGTGLGLFISRQLCEMQGGQIGVHSASGKGSSFTFYVKALRSDPPEPASSTVLLPRKVDQDAVIREVPNETKLPTQQTILLVEDNLVNQKVVAKMLRTQGFVVLVANHGGEAINHIKNSALVSGASDTAPPISLILLDIEMPVMDGLTCIRHIRKMEHTGELQCHVPVIATTANARQEQVDFALESGMDNVVTKPFRMAELLTVMTKLWEKYPIERKK